MVVGMMDVRLWLGFCKDQSIAFMASICSSSATCALPCLLASGYCFFVLGGVVVLSIFVGSVFLLPLRLRRGFWFRLLSVVGDGGGVVSLSQMLWS